jgi:hypothetical protein
VEARIHLPEALEELRELERAVERERLHAALNAVAQMQAARSAGVVASFREMQEQARDIDRRRVQMAVRIAELQKVDGRSSGTSERCACN